MANRRRNHQKSSEGRPLCKGGAKQPNVVIFRVPPTETKHVPPAKECFQRFRVSATKPKPTKPKYVFRPVATPVTRRAATNAAPETDAEKHNHARPFLYKYALEFEFEEKRWKLTDPPRPEKFDSLREVDLTAFNSVNASSIRDGSFDVMVSSAPYDASEHHKYDLTPFSAHFNVALSTFMVFQASPVLLDMIRSAHEQGLGDGKALATEQFNRELLTFLAIKGILRSGQTVFAWGADVQFRNGHVIPPPGYLQIVLPIDPCQDRCVVILSDRKKWKAAVAWKGGMVFLLSPGTTLSIGPKLRWVTVLVQAGTETDATTPCLKPFYVRDA